MSTPEQRRYFSTESSSRIRTGFQRYERPIFDFDAKDSPCRAGCPAGHDIAWALYLVARGREDLACETFREESPFPSITGRVCYHPCESVCNRGSYDEPVAIHSLERIIGDRGQADPVESPPRLWKETVGIVGSGPSGLTAGYHLLRLGYGVTIYEAADRAGGVLAYGIPAYRLPPDLVQREICRLEEMGLEIRRGIRVGEDLSLESLRERHEAIFLGVGLGQPRPLSVPVPRDPRVLAGLELLRRVAAGSAPSFKGSTLVIGGGDVAIDAARTALRLGSEDVLLCCPEDSRRMPAHPEEMAAAPREGVRFQCEVLPAAIQASEMGVEVTLCSARALDAQTNGAARFVAGDRIDPSELFGQVIYAIGQQADLRFLPEPLRMAGKLDVDPWGATRLAGVFAGGDVAGTYNVVNAIASGKRAAVGIDAYLRSLCLDGLAEKIGVGSSLSLAKYLAWRQGESFPVVKRFVPLEEINLDYFPTAPRESSLPLPPGSGAAAFREVNGPLSSLAAQREAHRCFNCGTCNMCGNCFRFCPDSSVVQREDWGFSIDLDHCKGCGICVHECPRSAMSMVPEQSVGG